MSDPFNDLASPLAEATPDSIDDFLSHIDELLAAGTPEKLTDPVLRRGIELWRVEALKWNSEEKTKAPRTRTPKHAVSPPTQTRLTIPLK